MKQNNEVERSAKLSVSIIMKYCGYQSDLTRDQRSSLQVHINTTQRLCQRSMHNQARDAMPCVFTAVTTRCSDTPTLVSSL